jgi:glycosyltransferase involved in cell wall biosynthesis
MFQPGESRLALWHADLSYATNRMHRREQLELSLNVESITPQRDLVSFVVVARNEPPPLLEKTVRELLQTSAGYTREIIVVDDASIVPVFLESAEIRVIRNTKPVGTSQARRYGMALSSGRVLVSMDAHMSFAPGWLERMLEHVESGALLCAAWWDYELTNPVCWGADFAWCGERNYAAGKSPGFVFRHRLENPGNRAVEVPMLIGACYAMLRKSYDQLGGFSPFLRTWGKLEQDLCLRAWIMGVGVKCVPGAHVGHFTRTKFPYPVRWADVEFNQVATVRSVFEMPVARAIEQMMRPLPAEVERWLDLVDFQNWQKWVQSRRSISDAEFLRRFVPGAPECLHLVAASGS